MHVMSNAISLFIAVAMSGGMCNANGSMGPSCALIGTLGAHDMP